MLFVVVHPGMRRRTEYHWKMFEVDRSIYKIEFVNLMSDFKTLFHGFINFHAVKCKVINYIMQTYL